MIREFKLGAVSLFKMAAGITKTETGLVSGKQVADYVEQQISTGSTGSWNGGTVTKPTTFNANVTLGYGPPVWLIYSNTNAGCNWDYIPEAAVPTKSQIEEFVLERTANTLIWYETASCPNTWLKRPSLPGGWYRVQVMLNSSNGDDVLGIINAAALKSGHVTNVMGLAWGGTDNSSCPYTTWDGVEWYDMCSAPVSRAMASIVRLDFLYYHRNAIDTCWLGEKLTTPYTGWERGVARYTGIPEPQKL